MTAITVELQLDNGTFTSGVIHAGETIEQFERKIGGTITSVTRMGTTTEGFISTLGSLSQALTLGGSIFHEVSGLTEGWAGEIVKINAEFERMKTLMGSLSNSSDAMGDASKQVTALRDAAKEAPFSLQAMHDSFVRLKSSGINPTMETLHSLTDAVAAFGGNDDTLKRASLAFQEMAGKGVVQMKELRNQLGMAIPNSIPLMARAMGVSYQELMNDVHTGTVDAKSAIEALRLEFERTFGGAAAAQMQTFNGQIARMQVLLQDLAINNVGKSGYFDAVKNQVTDFNNFLETSTAAGLGDMLGAGLTEGIQLLRSGVDEVIHFKDEISAAAEVLGTMFAGSLVLGGMNTAIGLVRNLQGAFTTLGLAARAGAESMAIADAQMAAGQIGLARNAWQNAAAGLGFMTEAAGTLMPWLLVLGPAIGFAAEYFGLFHDKTEEAYESLLKFGAATREQAQAGNAHIQSLQGQIDELNRLKAAQDKVGDSAFDMEGGFSGGSDTGRLNQKITELQKQLDEAKSKQPGFEQQGALGSEKTAFQTTRNQIDAELASFRRQYDEASKAAAAKHDKELNDLQGKHSPDAANAEYQETQRQNQLELYKQLEGDYEKHLASLKAIRDSSTSTDAQKGDAQYAMEQVTKDLVETQKQRIAAQHQPTGVQLDAKIFDGAKAFQKGQEALAKINDEIAGFSAGLDGVDPKVAALQSALDHGMKFGDTATEQVKDLISQLTTARGEADLLNDAMKGQNKFNHDLANIGEQLDEKLFAAQHPEMGDMSDIDKLMLKVQNGLYKGIGPNRSAVQEAIDAIQASSVKTSQAATELGTTLATKAFGGPAKTAADAMLEVANRIASTFGLIGSAASKIALPGSAGQASGVFGLNGPNLGGPAGSGDYFSKLIQRESSGNPNAGASNPAGAVGLGQFMPGTWEQFLKAMHPDMQGREDLRTDPTMSVEATKWYTAQNAQKLAGAGIDTNDANLYRAHFLGAQGAITSLQGDPSTKFSDVSSFAAAVRANPTILGNGATFGSLTAQIQKQFGTGNSGVAALSTRNSTDGLSDQNHTDITADKAKQAQLDILLPANKLAEALTKLNLEAQKSADQGDENRKHWAGMREQISSGTFGKNKNPDDPMYKPLLTAADAADHNDATLDNNKKTRTKADDAMAEARKDLEAQQGEHDARWASITKGAAGGGSLDTSSDMLRTQKASAERLAAVKASYGEESTQYKELLAEESQIADQQRDGDITKNIEALQKKTQSLRESLMTEDQAKQDAYDKDIAKIDGELSSFKGSEAEKLALMKTRSDYAAAYAAKDAAGGPMAQQFQQWTDISKQFQTNMNGWLSSTTSSIAQFVVTGKTDWKSLTQGITEDIVKMGLQWGIGSLGGAAKTGVSSLFGSAAGGAGKLGAAHNATGDNNFAGGLTWVGEKGPELVSLPSGASIDPANTVPAMARQGAGSTQAQMAAATVNTGDTHQYNIQMTPTLNATGGTPIQNADLAAQMSAHVEASMRRVVSSELQKQMRPGNMLDGKNFT